MPKRKQSNNQKIILKKVINNYESTKLHHKFISISYKAIEFDHAFINLFFYQNRVQIFITNYGTEFYCSNIDYYHLISLLKWEICVAIKKTLYTQNSINKVRILKESKTTMSEMIFKQNEKNNWRKIVLSKKNKISIKKAMKQASWMSRQVIMMKIWWTHKILNLNIEAKA